MSTRLSLPVSLLSYADCLLCCLLCWLYCGHCRVQLVVKHRSEELEAATGGAQPEAPDAVTYLTTGMGWHT